VTDSSIRAESTCGCEYFGGVGGIERRIEERGFFLECRLEARMLCMGQVDFSTELGFKI